MEVDRGRYEPLPLALRGPIEQVESYLVRPITPQRSPRRGSGSPLSRTVVGLESNSPQPAFTPSRESEFLVPSSRLRLDFDPEKQFWRLFTRGLIRFMMTLLLAILLMVTIMQFGRKQVISRTWKRWFNAINLGLSMALGVSVQYGFKRMAVDLRWRILSLKRRSMSEVDKILRSESLTVVIELLGHCLWQNPLKWKLRMITVCTIWLSVNLAAQISIAVIGLNYGTSGDFQHALTTPGPVLIPNLTQIYPLGFDGLSRTSISAQQYTANSFGSMALGFLLDPISRRPKEKTFWTPPVKYFYPDDFLSWVYVFLDHHSTEKGDIAVYTRRSVNATWGCQSWIVTHGGNGTVTNITVLKDGNGGNFKISLPAAIGPDQTTFFTDPTSSCGSGCTIVEAFEASNTESWFYRCNITVGTVQNATLPEHQIGIKLRRIAAGAIALKGYGMGPTLSGTRQYQVYPSQSVYGQPMSGSERNMGSLMGQFTIGVIAAAAQYSNMSLWLTVQGDQPQIGAQLQIERWLFIWLILGLIVAAQGVGFVVTAFWANRVIVKDESVFSTATLLRSVMTDLDGSGNAAGAEALFRELEGTSVIYTAPAHSEDKNWFHLELSNNTEARRIRAFQEGTYD